MINKILKELDHMIKFQEKEIELDMQAEELEGKNTLRNRKASCL